MAEADWTNTLSEHALPLHQINDVQLDMGQMVVFKTKEKPLVVSFGVEIVVKDQVIFGLADPVGVQQIARLKSGIEGWLDDFRLVDCR